MADAVADPFNDPSKSQMGFILTGEFLSYNRLKGKKSGNMFLIVRIDDGTETLEVMDNDEALTEYMNMERGALLSFPVRVSLRTDDRNQTSISIARNRPRK